MEENTGSGALPRNKGLKLSRGEYIQFLDADDMLTKTALEELYSLAKEYDSDAIYCEKHYESDEYGKNLRVASVQKGGFVDKPTLEPTDLEERVRNILDDRYLTEPWNKFVKRDLIMKNEIFFPAVKISEDNIWVQGLLFCSKSFLRVPNVVIIHRMSENSMVRVQRSPQQRINFWLNPVMLGLKSLERFMDRQEFFKENPSLRFALFKKFIESRFTWTLKYAKKLTEDEVFLTIKDEFSGRLGEQDILISALCTTLYAERNDLLELANVVSVGRFDIKFLSKEGTFQILSVSDKKAVVEKPSWINKDGTGYVLRSYAGKIEVVVKSDINGKIHLQLKSRDVRDPGDKSIRIPYWIDYTKLAVNDKIIFDKLTPVWHDKPYRCNINVNADEEIRIQAEWQPHLDERTDLSAKPAQIQKSDTSAKPAQIQKSDISAKPAQIQKSETSDKSAQIREPDTPKSVVQIQENNSALLVIDKFKNYLTARVDLTLMEGYTDDLQIFSISDDKVTIKKPAWLQKDGICYQIESYAGNMEIVAKAFADGQLNINLKGIWVPDPEDKSKRLRYWIDFTKCIVNGEVIFDKITPVWNGKPYVYNKEVTSGEEIKINVEWQPHRGKA